jgi:hypothetical protein
LTGWCLLRALTGGGLVRRFQRLAAAACWLVLAITLGSAALVVQLFHAFAGETLVAQVTTERIAPQRFTLTYQPAEPGKPPKTMTLRGDQWAFTGGIVKWHPWLTALGLSSYHKPRWMSGQFADLGRQQAQPPTIYPLEPLTDPVWEGLYWADPYLPFVEAVYGSSAFVYVEPGIVQDVFVTPSGYMIKRQRR